jgi:hypothetical protein
MGRLFANYSEEYPVDGRLNKGIEILSAASVLILHHRQRYVEVLSRCFWARRFLCI